MTSTRPSDFMLLPPSELRLGLRLCALRAGDRTNLLVKRKTVPGRRLSSASRTQSARKGKPVRLLYHWWEGVAVMWSHRIGYVSRWAGLGLLSLCAVLLFSQDNAQHSQSDQQRTVTTPLLVNVTGCLKKSGTSGGYYIADQNGGTWELTSKKVDLAKQVFHTVSVSGHPSAPSKMREGTSEQSQKPKGNQTFTLDVTELEMVSPSCTR